MPVPVLIANSKPLILCPEEEGEVSNTCRDGVHHVRGYRGLGQDIGTPRGYENVLCH